jgi:ISXO2-like transposase domain/Transposase zinc-ribbon domain
MVQLPRSLSEFERSFCDEATCAEYLAAVRWPDGFVCPGCGGGKAWRLETKSWTYECAGCGRQTSVTAGTIMHHSKLPLTTWFWAAYVMATQPNGISALQLQRELGLGSYKTAWLLCAKLRRSMAVTGGTPLSGLVEVAEAEIPRRSKHDPATHRGLHDRGKLLVVAAVEVQELRPGRIRLSAVPDPSAASLQAFLAAHLAPGAIAKNEGWRDYSGAPKVNHSPQIIGGTATRKVLRWVDRIFSDLKLWAISVYHGLRRRHLQSYLDEFTFRFNRRGTRYAAFPSLLGLATGAVAICVGI